MGKLKEEYDELIKTFGLSWVKSEAEHYILESAGAEQKAELDDIDDPEIYFEKIMPLIKENDKNDFFKNIKNACIEDNFQLLLDKQDESLWD